MSESTPYKIIRKKENKTAVWAGGTTTQLFIFPPEAEYTKFNFLFRISYATVEVEESTFTFMPGVTRHLMIIEGKLEIDHTNRYKKSLEKYDSDIFSGEWPTTAKGKVKDFNLMTKENAKGNIKSVILNENMKIQTRDIDHFAIYLVSGKIKINGNEILNSGDFMITSGFTGGEITISALEKTEMIVSEIIL